MSTIEGGPMWSVGFSKDARVALRVEGSADVAVILYLPPQNARRMAALLDGAADQLDERAPAEVLP